MTAKRATVNDCRLARQQDFVALRDERVLSGASGDHPQSGIQFDCGYLSPYFITDPERMEVAFENVGVLIYGSRIASRKELLPLLEQMASSGKPLLIIAEDLADEARAALVVNKLRGSLQVAAVKLPGFAEQRASLLQSIALLTGAREIAEGRDGQLRDMRMSDLGQASRIIVDKNHTEIEVRGD